MQGIGDFHFIPIHMYTFLYFSCAYRKIYYFHNLKHVEDLKYK